MLDWLEVGRVARANLTGGRYRVAALGEEKVELVPLSPQHGDRHAIDIDVFPMVYTLEPRRG